jgi:uncharacterized membrane protein YphA (DoxX/SURF4 family)
LSCSAEKPIGGGTTVAGHFGDLGGTIKEGGLNMSSRDTLLRFALAAFGAVFLLVYPLAIVWPSGWAWHHGTPYESQYFMMIVGIYATLGVFLLLASRDPQSNRSLISFTIWSSLVHAGIMGVQSLNGSEHMGHLLGDIPALVLVAVVLSVLAVSPEKT